MAGQYSANTELVSRFCSALLDLASQQQAIDTIQKELQQLGAAIGQNPELQTLVQSPLFRPEQKTAAIMEILKKSGASKLLTDFVGTVASNSRLNLLPEIIDLFSERLMELRGEIRAEVVSARALDAGQLQQLQGQIGQMFAGKKVVLATKVDPAILGGIAVRVGSTMIDSSLRTKLDGLGLALKGAA